MPAADDWRRSGQEEYLPPGTEFARRPYRAYREDWDHDHCEFCWATLVEAGSPASKRDESLTEGYATTDHHPKGADYHWVCPACFEDFSEELGWLEVPAT